MCVSIDHSLSAEDDGTVGNVPSIQLDVDVPNQDQDVEDVQQQEDSRGELGLPGYSSESEHDGHFSEVEDYGLEDEAVPDD